MTTPPDLLSIIDVRTLPGRSVRLDLSDGQFQLIHPGDRADVSAALPYVLRLENRVLYVPFHLRGVLLAVLGTDTFPHLIGVEKGGDTFTLHSDGFAPLTLVSEGAWIQPMGHDPAYSAPTHMLIDFFPPGFREEARDTGTIRPYRFQVDSSSPHGAGVLIALGQHRFANPPMIEAVEPEEPGYLQLTIRQGGELATHVLPCPVPWVLTGPGGEAPRRLIVELGGGSQDAFLVGLEVWPQLMPLLSGQPPAED